MFISKKYLFTQFGISKYYGFSTTDIEDLRRIWQNISNCVSLMLFNFVFYFGLFNFYFKTTLMSWRNALLPYSILILVYIYAELMLNVNCNTDRTTYDVIIHHDFLCNLRIWLPPGMFHHIHVSLICCRLYNVHTQKNNSSLIFPCYRNNHLKEDFMIDKLRNVIFYTYGTYKLP